MAVRRARRQLEEEGYLHTRRSQDAETGRWTTQVLVSNVPLASPEEVAEAFGSNGDPSDQDPPVGDPAEQALGAYPLGESPKDNTPDPAPDGARAAAFLTGLVDHEPALRLGARDVERLAPLAAHALATGATETDLRRTLTTDLPRPVRAPAALISYRLENRPPPVASPTPATRKRVEPLGECADCRDPLPRGMGEGICRSCAGVAPRRRASAPAQGQGQGQGMRDVIAMARAALRTVD
ncbi:hypothetical protein ACIBUY_29190 [Streptomyces sp. NPDC050085]|uniref:hypothetical protein n=1 Tax=Streptomyces sp. NPDC050085 TaxID=3365600 RepID=UPI0037A1765D